MANGEMHSVSSVCLICGAETEMKIDDDAFNMLNKLEDADDCDIDINDYIEAFHDQKLAAFLYTGYCAEHSNLALHE